MTLGQVMGVDQKQRHELGRWLDSLWLGYGEQMASRNWVETESRIPERRVLEDHYLNVDNGVGHADFRTIQAACDYIAANATSTSQWAITIRPGTYTEDISITVPVGRVRFEGEGAVTVQGVGTDTNVYFDIQGRVEFHGIKFIGAGSGNLIAGQPNTTLMQFFDCELYPGSLQWCVREAQAEFWHCWLEHTIASPRSLAGSHIASAGGSISFYQCRFKGWTTSGNDAVVENSLGSDIFLFNCYITNAGNGNHITSDTDHVHLGRCLYDRALITGDYVILDGDFGTLLPGDLPDLLNIPPSTYKTIQDLQNTFHSGGWISGGAITSGGGTPPVVNVATGAGLVRSSNSSVAPLYFFDWPAASGLSLTNAETKYWVVARYNGGSPDVVLSSTEPNHRSEIVLGFVFRESDHTLHIQQIPYTVGDHAHLMNQFNQEVMPFAVASGLATSETGDGTNRRFAIAAGEIWHGLTEVAFPAFDTAVASTFSFYYLSAVPGVWTKQASQTDFNNSDYDDQSGTLNGLTANRYGVTWIYVDTSEGDVFALYGVGDYTLGQAQASTPPSSVPPVVEANGKLVARIICQEGTNTSTQIDTYVGEGALTATGVTDHNSLSGLQGGTSGEYYHLTSAQHTALTTGAANTVIGFTALNTLGSFTLASTVGANQIPIGGALGAITWSGIQTISNTTESTLYTNGAQVIAGGVGIAKQLNVLGHVGVGVAAQSDSVLMVVGDIAGGTAQSIESTIHVTADTTIASSFYNGVDVAAGVALGASIGVFINDPTKGAGASITINYGLFISSMLAGATNYSIFTGEGIVSFGDTTDATSISTGAVRTAGGFAATKAIWGGTTLSLAGTSNQIVLQASGVTGTLTWTPASSNKVITLPNLTGTTALGAGTLTAATTNSVAVADHTHGITTTAVGAASTIVATNASGAILASSGLFASGITDYSYQEKTLSIAVDGVAQVGNVTNQFAFIVVLDLTGGGGAMYFLRGAANATFEAFDAIGSFSVTAGTGTSTNIYWSAGNSRYEIQNKQAQTRSYRIFIMGAAG
jgi:hypothetical protein